MSQAECCVSTIGPRTFVYDMLLMLIQYNMANFGTDEMMSLKKTDST